MLYVEGKHELRACDTQLRLGVSYLKEYVALNNTNGFSGITIRAEIYFILYARDSAYSARDKFRHQNSTVRAGRACALNSRAVISLSTRWKHCHGGGGGGGGIGSQGSRRKTYGFTHLRSKRRHCPASQTLAYPILDHG